MRQPRGGFTQWHDNYPATSHLPGLIARFGGQMYTFEGDKPVKIDVASPEAKRALFVRAHRALRPGGMLIDADCLLNTDSR